MLERPGDLIPVKPTAATIPWTRRRSQILNFLHRGPVTFSTLVYDTNVGDISSLASYFNEERISVDELNSRFGHNPFGGETNLLDDAPKIGNESVVMPRLLLYPERLGPTQETEGKDHAAELDSVQTQVTVQRTLDWVMSQKLKARAKAGTVEKVGLGDTGRSDLLAGLLSSRSSGWCEVGEETLDGGYSRPPVPSKRWSGTGGGSSIKGSSTEPTDLAAALDVVSRALCDRTWTGGREMANSW